MATMKARVADNATAAVARTSSLALANRISSLALVAIIACSSSCAILSVKNDGVVGGVSAFSPSCHRAAASPLYLPGIAKKSATFYPKQRQSRRASFLSYKHREDEDSPEISLDGKNETALPNIRVDVDVNVEITTKDVIFYNDLDPAPVSSNSFNASFTTMEEEDITLIDVVGELSGKTSTTRSNHQENEIDESSNNLIAELEDAIQQKNIDPSPPSQKARAIEPSSNKPTKKFISPIQIYKKIPRVEPIHMSTVFFLKLIGDPMWTKSSSSSAGEGSTSGSAGTAFANPPGSKKEPKKKKPVVVESWKTKMQSNNNNKKRTAFQATNYLEALSATNGNDSQNNSNNDSKNKDQDDMLRALRDQQAQNRAQAQAQRQQAFIEATRRTNPKEAIEKRVEEAHKERKRKERENLERLYVERKERLDAKERNERLYLEERRRQREILEGKAKERAERNEEEETVGEVDMAGIIEASNDDDNDSYGTSTEEEMTPAEEFPRPKVKRGIPILDILSRPPVIDAPPLLVGSTVTFQYSDLTPFQKRAIDVARGFHEEHCQKMKLEESEADGCDVSEMLSKPGCEGGIQAAPIVAIIDSYTASAMEADELTAAPQQQQQQDGGKKKKRFATLAAIEIVENDFDNGEPSAVKFRGVSRAFLHGYFSSKDVGLTEEEEELNQLLARIQQFDAEEEEFDEEYHESVSFVSEHEEEDEDTELPVVMAEFDIFLDDLSLLSKEESTKYGEDVSKNRASSMHAITELYRTANKVYRLHEERKKLVAGLRAGVARLRMGKKRIAEVDEENCLVEYEDCDGLGLIGGVVLGDASSNFVDESIVIAEHEEEDMPIRSRLETMDNYGFGSYGILSTIPDLTSQLRAQLEPYYSPAHREREEYDAEVASMVVFQTLQKYCTSEEVARALLAPSATKRLEMAYDIMMRHSEELDELVKIISEDLMDCGEECTDLW